MKDERQMELEAWLSDGAVLNFLHSGMRLTDLFLTFLRLHPLKQWCSGQNGFKSGFLQMSQRTLRLPEVTAQYPGGCGKYSPCDCLKRSSGYCRDGRGSG